jgi:RNA polymerase sigma-70 factor (ECF subfamily)
MGGESWAGESTDAELLSEVAARNPEALGQLFARHAPRVLGMLQRLLGRGEDAEDLLQDTFVQVWNIADRYDPGRSPPLAWLLMLARSRALDYLRTRRPTTAAYRVEQGSGPAGPSELERTEQSVRLTLALDRLPEEQREALTLAFFDGMTHAQIANLQNVPLGTVKTRIRLALRKLRELVDPPHEGEGTA